MLDTDTAIAFIQCYGAFFIMSQIISPKIGSIVKHKGLKPEQDVLITDGKYNGTHGVSNFWYWKRILPCGTLLKEEFGYGNFEKSENEYKIETTVILVK